MALLCWTVGGWLATDRKSRLLGRYSVQWAERGKGIGLAVTAQGIDHWETGIAFKDPVRTAQ